MRGVFSVDMVLALFLLLTLIGAAAPNWEEIRDAARVAICSYVSDAYTSYKEIVSYVGVPAITNFYEGGIRIENDSISIWIVSREVSC